MTPLPLLLVLLAAGPVRFHEVQRPAIEAEVAALSKLPAGWERTKAATERFLGTPYAHSPLGEGEGVDADPRVRYDAVDCVTYVETALAIGNTDRLADAERLLDELRYLPARPPSYGARLHFFEAQWIPAQVQRGYVEDVTRKLGGSKVMEAVLPFTKESWESRTGFREVDMPWEQAPHGTFTLPIIPMEDAQRLTPTLPDGLLLVVVRENQAGNPTIVSHVGFVIVKDGQRYLRHAMLANKAVTDEELASFLERHGKFSKWKVRGVNLLAVRDNAAHARKVLGGK